MNNPPNLNKAVSFLKLHLAHAGGGIIVIAAAMAVNVLNFACNAYLGRMLGLSDFGTVSLLSGILSLLTMPLFAFSATVSYRSAHLSGKYGGPPYGFWRSLRRRTVMPSVVLTGLWLAVSPLAAAYYQTGTVLPFVLVAPVWCYSLIAGVDRGYITGTLRYGAMAVSLVSEVAVKLVLTVVIVSLGGPEYVYTAIPLSGLISFIISWRLASRIRSERMIPEKEITAPLPGRFLASSIVSKLSATAFISFDLILAKHYLPPAAAGEYALLSLGGKIVYFVGTLFSQFIVPVVARNEGAGTGSKRVFLLLIGCTLACLIPVYVTIGIFSRFTMPLLFGERASAVAGYMPVYALSMAALSIAGSIVLYHQSKKRHLLSLIGFFLSLAMVGTITVSHASIGAINTAVAFWCMVYAAVAIIVFRYYRSLSGLTRIPDDFASLFLPSEQPEHSGTADGRLRILIFNWRDTKHVWAGGAETYIHELAKRWVAAGHSVTQFSGNDARHARYESVDGVTVYRRGGFYMVYVWAVIYYLFRFRGEFDVIIDSENGIPFFTPLFAREPVLLLIHHIHQDVFRRNLVFPFSRIAMLLESRLMPVVYRNCRIITVSQSSRDEILRLGITTEDRVGIVNPGINPADYRPSRKTSYPSVLYLGRLCPWKNVDILIRAFAGLRRKKPTARLTIAGDGVSRTYLEKLARTLCPDGSVVFTGKVTDEEKVMYLGSHWVAVQPSLVEGWGITVIEANACGTPVIASDTNGLRDSVLHGQTGFLVEARSVSNLQLNIRFLIDNSPFRKQLTRNALAWARQFTWENSALSFMDIIESALGEAERSIRVPRMAWKGIRI